MSKIKTLPIAIICCLLILPFVATAQTAILNADGSPVRTEYCYADSSHKIIGTPAGGTFSGCGIVVKGTNTYFNPVRATTGVTVFPYQCPITYTATNGSTATENILIQKPVVPNAGDDTVTCTGAFRLSVGLSYAGNYSYSWAPAAGLDTPNERATNGTTSTTQTYVITATDLVGGCSAADTVTVFIDHIVKPQITLNGQQLSTTQPYYTYQWLLNGKRIQGATSATYNVSANGDYKVVVSESNGCIDTSAIYTITNATGVDNISSIEKNITIHPNPANTVVYIDAATDVNVSVTSIDGKIVLQQHDTKMLDVSSLAKGLYLVHITDKKGHLLRIEKLVKTGN